MRTFILSATLTALGASSAWAQTPPSPAPATVVPGAMVTVVGCITRESASPGAAANAQAPSDAMQYVLTDVTPPTPPNAPPSGTATSGATPTGGQKPARKMYVLMAHAGAVDFAPHLNHIVRVTGASTAPMTTAPLAGRSPEAAPVGGDTAPPGATGTIFDTSNLPTLTVTTLAIVSSSCR